MKSARYFVIFIFSLFLCSNTASAFTINYSSLRKIFSPQLSTNTINASVPSDFFFGKNIIEDVLNSTSNSTTSIKDVILNYFNSGSVETRCSLFVQDGGNTPIYTAVNPSIATVNSDGSTTYISSGLAQFNARIGRRIRSTFCNFNRTNNTVSYTFNDVVSTSTIKNIKTELDTRINGLLPSVVTYDIYSAKNDSTQTYTRNTNMFAYDIDLTCIPTYSDAIGSAQTMGVLVAPDIMIQANHARQNGIMYFVTNGNATVSRSIISGINIPGTDIYVAKLNSDISANITPCKIFPATTFTNKISTTSISYFQPPVVFTNRNRTLNIGVINYYGFSPYVNIIRGDGNYYDWYSKPCCGDSGSPAFALVSGQAVLIGVWYGAYTVQNISNYITQINSAMTTLGSPHSLSTTNLSSFQTF